MSNTYKGVVYGSIRPDDDGKQAKHLNDKQHEFDRSTDRCVHCDKHYHECYMASQWECPLLANNPKENPMKEFSCSCQGVCHGEKGLDDGTVDTDNKYCVLHESPFRLHFEGGDVPCDEPPGLEEREYRRWKDAGGKVKDAVLFKTIGSKVAIGGSILMLAQRPITEFPSVRMARLVAELYEEWDRLQGGSDVA